MAISIKRKLILASIAVLATVAALEGVALYNLTQVSSSTSRLMANLRQIDEVQEFRVRVERLLMPPNDYLIHGDRDEENNFFELQHAVVDQLTHIHTGLSKPDHESISHLLKIVESHAMAIFAIADPVGDKTGSALMEKMEEQALQLNTKIDMLLAHTRTDADKAAASAGRVGAQVWFTMIGTGLLAILLAFAGTFLVVRQLGDRLSRLRSAVLRVSSGDLRTSVEIESGDEIGDIGRSFNEMLRELEESRANLIEAERLAAIGQMVVTISHEMNSPLQYIIGALDVAQTELEKMPEQGRVSDALEVIAQGCTNLREVVRQMGTMRKTEVTRYVGDVEMIDLEHSVG